MAGGSGFFEELKRRHVWRVAIAYAVVGWLLIQIATQVFPFFGIPEWTVRLVVVLLVLGFPLAVVLAWVYELTPEGIRRTEPAHSPDARAESDTRRAAHRLDTVIITVLVLAVALLGWRLLVLRHAPASAPRGTAAIAVRPARSSDVQVASASVAAKTSPLPASTAAVPQKSVAVLPFTNESGEPDEQFFSDGLSLDLITALSQFDGLKVISRNSSFQFRNSKDDSKTIGEKLGVAHLLEGNVRRQGGEVRISATLVNAADGSTLWSQHYDRPYQDLFALQDAITKAVAAALQAELLTTPGAVVQSDRPPGGSLEAYAAYQHGVAYVALGTEASLRKAVYAYNEAIRIDPRYAAAYAQLGRVWNGLAISFMNRSTATQANVKARAAMATALELDPNSSLAHEVHSRFLQLVDFDWAGAVAGARRALQLAPNDASAKFNLGFALANVGQVQQAAELTRQALESDPRHATWYRWLSNYLAGLGQVDAARQAIDTAIALRPGAATNHEQLAIIEILQGDAKAALAAARRETSGAWRAAATVLALQAGSDRGAADAALENLIREYGDRGPYQIAQVYALRRDPDAMFEWLDRAWTNHDPGIIYLLYDPFILRYQHDPRFAAFCKKVGLPTTTDAKPMP